MVGAHAFALHFAAPKPHADRLRPLRKRCPASRSSGSSVATMQRGVNALGLGWGTLLLFLLLLCQRPASLFFRKIRKQLQSNKITEKTDASFGQHFRMNSRGNMPIFWAPESESTHPLVRSPTGLKETPQQSIKHSKLDVLLLLYEYQ